MKLNYHVLFHALLELSASILNYRLEYTTMITGHSSQNMEGFRLKGNVINELKMVSVITCTQQCLRHSSCSSINVLFKADNVIAKVCELIDENLESMPHGLVASPGWMYYSVVASILPLSFFIRNAKDLKLP